jgi:hypothetical protein
MGTDLIAMGIGMREAYARSATEGQRYMQSLFSREGLRVYHVPAGPDDGRLIPPDEYMKGVEDEITAFDKLRVVIDVGEVRQAGDETLIVETYFAATGPDGSKLGFPNVWIWTVREGHLQQVIEVMGEGIEAFGAAFQAVAG